MPDTEIGRPPSWLVTNCEAKLEPTTQTEEAAWRRKSRPEEAEKPPA